MSNFVGTYNFYDKQGRRLAVFCRFLDYKTAEIFTLTCSKDDQFSKEFARKTYYLYTTYDKIPIDVHPKIVTIDIEPEERELKTLLRYCKDNYFRCVTITFDIDNVYKMIPNQKTFKLITIPK